ncbi:hypothetical protein SEA_LIFES_95 [Microbacterium phage Lifes]|nr:hypothetical protein SEA_LIFES_95 [Microbacterium phage Lifes]
MINDDGREALIEEAMWAHCSPELLADGLDCSSAIRRPCGCVPENGGHDHHVPRGYLVAGTAAQYQPCHFDTSGMYAQTWCHTHGQDHLTPAFEGGFRLSECCGTGCDCGCVLDCPRHATRAAMSLREGGAR